jgi:hypothetical protein
MTTNHAGAVRDLSDLEDAANVVKTVENFVRDNYGATGAR